MPGALTTEQAQQVEHLLRAIEARGFGTLTIRIEAGRVRWLRPAWQIHNPLGAATVPLAKVQPLPVTLGVWAQSFDDALGRVLCTGYGHVEIGVEHGRIAHVGAMLDLNAGSAALATALDFC